MIKGLLFRFRQGTAVAVSVCLLWSSGQMAEAVSVAPQLFTRPQLPQFEYAPPSQLAQVIEHFNAPRQANPAGKLVILVQDLHVNYSVQRNIAGILDFLADKLGGQGK